MVNKVSGRKLGAHHIEYRKLAENAEIGSVSRGQLIGLVKNMKKTGFIKKPECELLLELLDTASKNSFEKGGIPIVFKSNKELSFDIDRSEGRVSRLLSRLYNNGFVVMRDSGNFKRYAVRRPGHGIITACGVDLRILVARYHELKQKVDEVLDVRERQKEALHYFRGLVRQIKASYAEIEATPLTSLLFSRMYKIIHIIGRPVKASVEKLHKAIHLFEWILQRGFKVKTSKTTYTYVASDIHIEHTTPNLICNCNKNECSNVHKNNKNIETTENYAKTAYEKIQKSKTETSFSLKNSKLLQIKPEMLAKALPNAVLLSDCDLQTESDLIRSMYPMSRIIKISEHAVEQAKKIMGIEKAALAIAIIFEKYASGLVKSPGGYLRGMIDKEKQGELHLERSLFALLKQTSEEECSELNREEIGKNNQIKANFLFKSELDKIFETFKMPRNPNEFA